MRLPVWISLLLLCAARALACEPATFEIAVDAGHDIEAGGATSAMGRPEFAFNRELAIQVMADLRAAGFAKLTLINPLGGHVSLSERVGLANATNAAVFLSLHHDVIQPQLMADAASYSGYSLFTSAENGAPEASVAFARLIGEELRKAGLAPTLHHAAPIPGEGRMLLDAELGVYRFDELAVLRRTHMPAVLLEAGVIVNPAEETRLRDPAFQARFGRAVTAAMRRFCGE